MKCSERITKILDIAKGGNWTRIPRVGADLRIAVNSLLSENREVFRCSEDFLNALEKHQGVKKIIKASSIEAIAYAIYAATNSEAA